MLDPGRTLLAGWCKWLMVNFQLSYWHRTNGAVRYILVNNSRVNVKWYGRIKVYACVCTADCHLVNSLQDMKDLCDGYSMIVASRFMFDLFGWFPCTEQWTLLSKINIPSLCNICEHMFLRIYLPFSAWYWIDIVGLAGPRYMSGFPKKKKIWFWPSFCMCAPLLGCHASKRAVHGPHVISDPTGTLQRTAWGPDSKLLIVRHGWFRGVRILATSTIF
jgi:hypothetical protein